MRRKDKTISETVHKQEKLSFYKYNLVCPFFKSTSIIITNVGGLDKQRGQMSIP